MYSAVILTLSQTSLYLDLWVLCLFLFNITIYIFSFDSKLSLRAANTHIICSEDVCWVCLGLIPIPVWWKCTDVGCEDWKVSSYASCTLWSSLGRPFQSRRLTNCFLIIRWSLVSWYNTKHKNDSKCTFCSNFSRIWDTSSGQCLKTLVGMCVCIYMYIIYVTVCSYQCLNVLF